MILAYEFSVRTCKTVVQDYHIRPYVLFRVSCSMLSYEFSVRMSLLFIIHNALQRCSHTNTDVRINSVLFIKRENIGWGKLVAETLVITGVLELRMDSRAVQRAWDKEGQTTTVLVDRKR